MWKSSHHISPSPSFQSLPSIFANRTHQTQAGFPPLTLAFSHHLSPSRVILWCFDLIHEFLHVVYRRQHRSRSSLSKTDVECLARVIHSLLCRFAPHVLTWSTLYYYYPLCVCSGFIHLDSSVNTVSFTASASDTPEKNPILSYSSCSSFLFLRQ